MTYATPNKHGRLALLASCAMLALAGAGTTQTAAAQAAEAQSEDDARIGDILVTAQKRGVAERAQDVPIAITAFNAKSIEDGHLRDLQTLGTSIPNVALTSVGTIPGFANFEIRGFGITGSIPSIEPAVGVFVDGIYLGQSAGIVVDIFDLESVEVLRGPQGTLFGRNTTGGAVSMRTRRPGDEFKVMGRLTLESGPQYTGGLSVEGPLIEGKLRGKIAGYFTHDTGWFHNRFDNSKFGKQTFSFIRPTLVWDVTDDIDTTLIYERASGDGDGATATNPVNNSGFDVNLDNPGYFKLDRQSITSETNIHVPFGDGVITNIAGWRELKNSAGEDFDATPVQLFDIDHYLKQSQFSEELRYAGGFGPVKLTIGAFYFQQKYNYIERRITRSAATGILNNPFAFGGRINQKSWAIFGESEIRLVDSFSALLGGRYSWEKKKAKVATLIAAAPLCNFSTLTCTYNFPGPSFAGQPGTDTWTSFTPKVGFKWQAHDDAQIYGSWSKGIRSGGYNVRSNSPVIGPGPYDQEVQSSFEIGLKSDLLDRRLRVNLSAFHNTIKNLQRDVSRPFPVVGNVQVTSNVGTARIQGVEAEVTIVPASGWLIGMNGGYLDGGYKKLIFDLNGALPGLGENLKLARLRPWSYGVNMSYSHKISDDDKLTLSGSYNYRSGAFFSDVNSVGTRITPVRELRADATMSFNDDRFSVSVFGRNLLDKLMDGGRALTGYAGSFGPTSEGRTIGVEARFSY
jgi:iron complex outermembrane receptor protein